MKKMPKRVQRDSIFFEFGTKSETLARIAPLVRVPKIPEQSVFTARAWRDHPESVIADILARFPAAQLAIRSSSRDEDTAEHSNAGAFESCIDVLPQRQAITEAVEQVLRSYGEDGINQEVLVQPMVQNIAISGVVLSRDLEGGAPYYVINYDDFSGRSDTVTGGAESKTLFVHTANLDALRSPRMKKIVDLMVELERVTGIGELDAEFCVSEDLEIHLLQVRPLAARHQWQKVENEALDAAIEEVRGGIAAGMTAKAGLAGRTTIYSDMSDWNPAEIIGNTPNPLAVSLYRRLVTENTWSRARAIMGYRDVPYPLMVVFCGRPYIDVRLSLNSFLPVNIASGFADRLVTHQLEILSAEPSLHDKIEFKVATTCLDFGFSDKAAELRSAGFSSDDVTMLQDGLHQISHRALSEGVDGLNSVLAVTRRFQETSLAKLQQPDLALVRRLLEETIEYGTLPFSILARHAFIGVSLLRSLVSRGVLQEHEKNNFMRCVHTVASDVVSALAATSKGSAETDSFFRRFGHLRPGTYDIMSWRYDERPDIYLGKISSNLETIETPAFEMNSVNERSIAVCLNEANFGGITPRALLDYVATSIAYREEAKFAFSRGLSDALAVLCSWGEDHGLSREAISFLTLDDIFDHNGDASRLTEISRENREAHRLTRAIRLPGLIADPNDIDVVRLMHGQPTYVTNKSITSPLRCLKNPSGVQAADQMLTDLAGAVILIERADPGYDWLFSRGIAGLITKYGGANSHMAIRCAEFGMPAAIGCGDHHYAKLLSCSTVELDCAGRKLIGH